MPTIFAPDKATTELPDSSGLLVVRAVNTPRITPQDFEPGINATLACRAGGALPRHFSPGCYGPRWTVIVAEQRSSEASFPCGFTSRRGLTALLLRSRGRRSACHPWLLIAAKDADRGALAEKSAAAWPRRVEIRWWHSRSSRGPCKWWLNRRRISQVLGWANVLEEQHRTCQSQAGRLAGPLVLASATIPESSSIATNEMVSVAKAQISRISQIYLKRPPSHGRAPTFLRDELGQPVDPLHSAQARNPSDRLRIAMRPRRS